MKRLMIGGLVVTTMVAVGCAVRARILAKREAEIKIVKECTDEIN